MSTLLESSLVSFDLLSNGHLGHAKQKHPSRGCPHIHNSLLAMQSEELRELLGRLDVLWPMRALPPEGSLRLGP
jgi:hypothetical protein